MLGSDSCKLTVLLGMLLIKMSLFISWTPLIHPRNLYIHSLINCVLQRLSPLSHFCMFGLELHQAGFHLSLSMFSILGVSEGSCNSQIEGKDKVALILITAVHILHCNHSHTSAQMLGRRGDQHGVLLDIASGNPQQKEKPSAAIWEHLVRNQWNHTKAFLSLSQVMQLCQGFHMLHDVRGHQSFESSVIHEAFGHGHWLRYFYHYAQHR